MATGLDMRVRDRVDECDCEWLDWTACIICACAYVCRALSGAKSLTIE